MDPYHHKYKRFKGFVYLLMAICVANSFSFPWPKSFGIVEFLVALLLLVTFYQGYLDILVKPNLSYLFVIFFMVLGFIGLYRNPVVDVSRDVISYIYLGIPIAIYYSLRKHQGYIFYFREKYDSMFFWFLISFSSMGLIYSLRSIWPFAVNLNFNISALYYSQLAPHTDYIFLDPSLLFGACFLAVFGIGKFKRQQFIVGILCFSVSLLIIAAPFLATIRAPFFLYLLVVLMAIIFNYRAKSVFLIPILVLFMIIFSGVAENILLKHSQEGANAKIEEVKIIIDFMTEQSMFNLIFGNGFGGTYYSSILNTEVRFSHNIFSYVLFKGGLFLLSISLFIFGWVLLSLSLRIASVFKSGDSLAFSALLGFFASFMVSSLLEPGYKTLDYGLLLIVYVYFVLLRKPPLLRINVSNENINNFNQFSS